MVQISGCPEKSRHRSRLIKQVNGIIKDLDISSPTSWMKGNFQGQTRLHAPFFTCKGKESVPLSQSWNKVLPQSDCIRGAHKFNTEPITCSRGKWWNNWLSSEFSEQSLAKVAGFYDWIQQIRVLSLELNSSCTNAA